MDEKARIKWEKLRVMGKRKFVIQFGVLRWGILTAVLWSVFMHIAQPVEQWYIRPLIALVLFPLGGAFVGIISWNSNEKKYAEVKKE